MWSAGIGISWRGGSTKYRKAVAISTPFYFHRVASRATGMPVEPETGCLLFFVRDQFVHFGVPGFLYAIIWFLNWNFSTNSGVQGWSFYV